MNSRNVRIVLCLSLLIFAIIIISIFKFNYDITKKVENTTYSDLTEIATTLATATKIQINEQFKTLHTLAGVLGEKGDLASLENIVFLTELAEKNGYFRTAIALSDGSYLTNDNLKGNISDREFFQKTMKGESYLSNLEPSVINPDVLLAIFAVPIYKNEKIIGNLSASFDTKEFDKLFQLSFMDGAGYALILQNTGEIVAGQVEEQYFSEDASIIDYIDNNSIKENDTLEHEIADMKRGSLKIQHKDGNISYLSYSPLGVNDWYVFTIAPETVLKSEISSIQLAVITLAIIVNSCFILLLIYVFYSLRANRLRLEKLNQKLKNSEAVYKVVAEQSHSMIFLYDYITKINTWENHSNENFRDMTEDVVVIPFDDKFLENEDIPQLKYAIESLTVLNPTASVEVRLKNDLSEMVWCEIFMTMVYDDTGEMQRLIGHITDIHEEKMQREGLEAKASRDNLTGLFNKVTTGKLISDVLGEQNVRRMHALISADIDHFKSINDTFGHLFGDKVLIEVAQELKKLFRTTDIVGRFGGDEYVILIKDIPNREFAIDKAIAMNKCLRINYEVDGVKQGISSSIGISFYPKDGVEYEELYEKADQALYNTKRAGKDHFSLYVEDKEETS